MPKFPIYGPILFDQGEICPHNKIAKTIKRVYHRDPPIRLKDVCQMRKLGDHKFQLENERNSNYLWHVTLNTGNNPYASAKPKNEPLINRAGAWNFHNVVFEKMRNGFRRYRAQTPAQKRSDTSAVEWIMKPRELTYDSSQEGFMVTHPHHIRRKRTRTTQSMLPAATGCKKRALCIESKARRDKYSLSAHFEEALAKSKKNVENVKRRTDNERVAGGEEQPNKQALRKSVIVKKKLADTLKKGVNIQQSMQEMKAALKKKKHTLKAVKYIRNAQKTGRTPQQQTQKPLTMPPVSPSSCKAPKLKLSTVTSQTSRLRKNNFQNFTQRLSDISIWCPRKSSFKCFEGLKQNLEFGKAFGAKKEDTSIAILRRITQAFKNPPKFPPATKIYKPLPMQSIPKALHGEPQKSVVHVNKVARVGIAVGNKKSIRHYRTFRRRAKHNRHVKDKPAIEQQHEDKAMQCINTKSSSGTLGKSSGFSVLLSESNKEIGAWLLGDEEHLRLAHESKLLRNSGMITPKETDKSEANTTCTDYTISFHTPITLRELIQRNARVKRSRAATNAKRADPKPLGCQILRH